jgi:hypothetical protein
VLVNGSYLPHRPLLVAAWLSAICGASMVSFPRDGRAQDHRPELTRFAGTYRYDGSRKHGQAIVEKAIDQALSEQSIVLRALVKKRLAERRPLIESISIATPPGQIIITLDDYRTAGRPGVPTRVKTREGERSTVKHSFKNGRLEQVFAGEKGTLKNVFTLLDAGKTLQREVTISGGRLPKPIRYRLLYKRR